MSTVNVKNMYCNPIRNHSKHYFYLFICHFHQSFSFNLTVKDVLLVKIIKLEKGEDEKSRSGFLWLVK